ncbi:MAG: hypothetical protein KKA84_06665 [Bacteroidetes bacterium]|nr:hypothetical protein [Bacteroidota bacterium]
MISAFIFTAHIVFFLVVFTRKWQTESLAAGLQNIILIVILFSVGWPLITMMLKMIIPTEGLGINLDRDAIVLTVLTAVEYFFYKFYYSDLFTEDGTEKQ